MKADPLKVVFPWAQTTSQLVRGAVMGSGVVDARADVLGLNMLVNRGPLKLKVVGRKDACEVSVKGWSKSRRVVAGVVTGVPAVSKATPVAGNSKTKMLFKAGPAHT
jgi:hypothetical protein